MFMEKIVFSLSCYVQYLCLFFVLRFFQTITAINDTKLPKRKHFLTSTKNTAVLIVLDTTVFFILFNVGIK